MVDPLKVLQVNYSDISGGAARAAFRIQEALNASGIDSRMLVNLAFSDHWSVQGPTNTMGKAISRIRPKLASYLCKSLSTGNPVLHSPALLPSCLPELINTIKSDVVHLHWFQGEMLSISDIPRIRNPIVWTLHDMWAFCGAEHYTTDVRWRDGYRSDNRPVHEAGFDLNRFIWNRKLKHWSQPFQIVCPSNGLLIVWGGTVG